MSPITVYTKPACVRAMFTFHALDRAKAAYTASALAESFVS